jgi:hypothetical protein
MKKELPNTICSRCNYPVKEDDDFCPECGTLFLENVECKNHKNIPAEGVCIICCEPFCKDCGFFVNDIYFLCNEHSDYEIFEGAVCVYSDNDAGHVKQIETFLIENGLHPIIKSEKMAFRNNYSPHNFIYGSIEEINIANPDNINIFVPCQEVLTADNLLTTFNA